MSKKEAFLAQLGHQDLKHADAIVLLQGDGHNRVEYVEKLFKDGYAPHIVLVGGDTRIEYGSFPSRELRDSLVERGVPEEVFVFEETAQHTRAEAMRVMELAKEKGWSELLLVTSPHHIYRAYLTFLQAMREHGLTLALDAAPAPLPWYLPTPWGTRADLFEQELERIKEYQEKGHVASFEEGLAYLEWKESQP